VLGQAFNEALGDRSGITRYASKFIPMDEALAFVCVDVSGRPYFLLEGCDELSDDMQLYEEFFRAFAMNAMITLHIRVHYGKNAHHIIEAVFKSTARAMREAVSNDEKIQGVPSTKGTLV
jgi:imidazoleglycerol-phosphate dehydratase